MKTKLLIIALFYTLFASAQIDNTQTWEVFYPGVKLTYHINACDNNEPEPTTDEYFWCDGPDRVVVTSFGLTHGVVVSSHEFNFNGNDYIVFATWKGISILNNTTKTWRNIPFVAFQSDTNTSQFYGAIDDGDGNIIFHGASSGTHKYSLTDNTLTQISSQNFGFEQFKKNENGGSLQNSIWATQNNGSSLMKYHNGVFTEYNSQDLDISSVDVIKGFDIGPDDKIYLAVDNKGLVIFDPVNLTTSLISDTNGLPTKFLEDVEVDANNVAWIAYRNFSNYEHGLTKWDIQNNTFEDFSYDIQGNRIIFSRLESVGDKLYLTGSTNSTSSGRGLYELSFENNNPVWKHYNEAFFQENGLVEHFYNFGVQVGIFDIASKNDKLLLSMPGNGVVFLENGQWSNISALQNNIPTGHNRQIGYVKQDKTGGIVFNSYTNNSVDKDVIVVSKFKDGVFTNYPLGRAVFTVNSLQDQGQVDANGKVYGVFSVNNQREFSMLDYPAFNVLLPDYNLSTSDKYAVEGFNKWYFDKSSGGRLTNLDTQNSYTSSNSSFSFNTTGLDFLTEGPDERVWSISSQGIQWYDPLTDSVGALTLPELSGNSHSEIGIIHQLLFGTGANELWLIGRNGIILLRDGTEVHKLLMANYDTLNYTRDAKLDADNNLYVVNSAGLLKIADVDNATPTTTEYKLQDIGPVISNFTRLTIDNEGNKWLVNNSGTLPKLLKFKEVNASAGIVNGAETGSLRGKISGVVYTDVNENGTYESNIDSPIVNQAIYVKNGNSSQVVYTNGLGQYVLPIYVANRTYEFAITSTDGFAYSAQRNFEVAVTSLDADYSNNNIALELEDLKTLYVKGATKSGAWGFNRPGFDNKFVSAIGNLSATKTFSDVTLRYEFINTNNENNTYSINDVSDIKLYKLKRNTNNHIINKVLIKSGRKQDWSVGLSDSEYNSNEITTINYTDTNSGLTKTLEIEIGEVQPFEAFVLEVYTNVFDPTAIGDVVQFGPTAISASNWEVGNGAKNTSNNNWRDITPDSPDNGVGRNEDFSPYTDPDDVYTNPDDIYRDPKDVYSDAPYETPIFSSYDPNDKLVTPGVAGRINEVDIDKKWLTYTVRFQNNGNFSAKDVYVLDTIDNSFDRYSFKMLESSHPMELSEVGTEERSIKKFFFKDIYLPDSLSNPEGSQGYFKYQIKAKEDISENTVVENTAHIYFDQNPAIITNTIQNMFRTPATASVNEYAIREDAFVYPNPANKNIRISLPNNVKISEVRMYNLLGREVYRKKYNTSLAHISVGNFSSGIYLVQIKGNQKIYNQKLIVE